MDKNQECSFRNPDIRSLTFDLTNWHLLRRSGLTNSGCVSRISRTTVALPAFYSNRYIRTGRDDQRKHVGWCFNSSVEDSWKGCTLVLSWTSIKSPTLSLDANQPHLPSNPSLLSYEMSGLPQYHLPDPLAQWPWQRKLSEHFAEVKPESDAWLRGFQALDAKSQRSFDLCNFCELLIVSILHSRLLTEGLQRSLALLYIRFSIRVCLSAVY